MLGSLGQSVARAWNTPKVKQASENSDEGAAGLITSSKRRGPDGSGDVGPSKRQRLSPDVNTEGAEATQRQPQGRPPGLKPHGPAQHNHHHRRRRGTLGTILSPVYFLLQQGSQQLAQHFGGTPVQIKQRPEYQQQRGSKAGGHSSSALADSPHSPVAPSGARVAGSDISCYSDSLTATAADDGGAEVNGGPKAVVDVECGDGDADVTDDEKGANEEEDDEEDDPLVFISRLPPAPPPVENPAGGTLLPRRTRTTRPRTLVLDLDETLVHATLDDEPEEEGEVKPDFTLTVPFNGKEHMVAVRMRPHVMKFLERASELFEVVVFTASQRVYAERLLNVLDPGRRLIRHRLYRDACVFYDGNYMKDLTGLGRDLAHTVIVDNSPQAFGFQVDNGIPIESWYDDAADKELLTLLPLLEQLSTAADVRPVLRERFQLRDKAEAAGAEWRRRVEAEAAEEAAARAAQRACATEQRRNAALGSLVQQVLPSPLRAAAAALGCA